MDIIDGKIFEQAANLANGDRNDVYGHPTPDLDAIGLAWSAILSPLLKDDVLIEGERVALCMAALKLVRHSVGKSHADNLIDACSYTAIVDAIERSR